MTSPEGPSVVLLTGQGRAAVASVLLEGDSAVSMVDALLHTASGQSLASAPLGRIVFGRWGSATEGEEVVTARTSDRSIEIHCHGGRAAARAILDALLERGCRELSWQDWVRRSTSDPIVADARMAVARAATERTALALWDQHSGALRSAIDEIHRLLADGNVPAASEAIDRLVGWWHVGQHLVEPWKVVLAGRPNVGKSSLINALVGYTRAIVHPTPGTTRDVVTASAAFDGWPVELADTAGLRAGGGTLEAAGMRLARDTLEAADLVLLVLDGSQPSSDEEQSLLASWPDALRVVNKCDLPQVSDRQEPDAIRTSAARGDGVAELGAAIVARLVPQSPAAGQPMPFVDWQVEALAAARAALASGEAGQAQAVLARFAPR